MRESEVFLMRNTKRELNPYSFYDTEGLAHHFERMAAEGWAPDRVGLFIRYRRIKPQKLRFAVAFYPDSDDTPEGEDVFIDYCEQAGWQHAVGAGALTFWGGNVDGEGGSHSGRSRHVFCTADENAVEIDTDPVLQVDATHRGLKPYCHWLVAFSVLQLLQMDNIIDDLQSDPLSVVSSNLNIRSVILQIMIIIICAAQLIGYYRWYGKAKQVAEEEGRFLAPKSRPWLQTFWRFVLLVTFFSAFAIGLFGSGSNGQGRLYYAALLSIAAPIAAAFFAHSSMERAGAGRKKRCAVTVIALVLAALASTGLLYTMKQNGLFESQQANVEWYSENGAHVTIYHDPLPLYLSDLGVEEGTIRWSCRSWELSSPLAAQRGGVQEDALGYPDPNDPNQYCGTKTRIYYTVSDVYLSALFDRCLSTELDYQERHPETPYVYNEVDAAPWDAEQAWRLYNTDTGEWCDYWLLVRGTRIVEFISSDLEMTDARMAIVGEKLLSADRK